MRWIQMPNGCWGEDSDHQLDRREAPKAAAPVRFYADRVFMKPRLSYYRRRRATSLGGSGATSRSRGL
jgi:hypothetical protein